jgi:hypothetical protein
MTDKNHQHGHDHSHSHAHKHEHHGGCGHSASDVSPKENRVTTLLSSCVSEHSSKWVEQNNTKIVIPAVSTLFLVSSHFNTNPYIATGLALSVPFVMNDVTENFMKAARTLEKNDVISRRATAAIGTFMHAGSEIFSAGVNAAKGFAGEQTAARALAINLTSTFTSQVFHLGTMFFGAAAIGRMGFVNTQEWKAHAKGIGGLTLGLGVPVVADAAVQAMPSGILQGGANVVNRAVGAIVSFKVAQSYMKTLQEFGDSCIVHGSGCSHGNEDRGDHHGHQDHTHREAEKEPLLSKLDSITRVLPKMSSKTGQDYVQSIPQRISKIPEASYLNLKKTFHTGRAIITDPAGRDAAISGLTMGALSWGMLHNIDVLSDGFDLTTSASGVLHGIGHSTPETLFILLAAAKGDRDMAVGAFGGCMAAMGVLGGALLVSGADIAESMRGTLMMSSYLIPPAAALAFSHKDVMELTGRVDEAASQWLKRNIGDRAKRVSNWLSNDGTSVARWIAVPATGAAVAATIAMSSQQCHTDIDESVDCGVVHTHTHTHVSQGPSLP